MPKSTLGRAIQQTQGISRYDAAAKMLLSFKMVIAFLVKALIPEFQNIDVATIAKKYIDPFHPGDRVMGLNTESLRSYGPNYRFDLLVEILTPLGIHMFLNIEIQNAFYRAESLFRRALVYGGRILSELDDSFFAVNQEIKDAKEFGMWLLTNPPKKLIGEIAYLPPLYDVNHAFSNWSNREKNFATSLQTVFVCAGPAKTNTSEYEGAANFVHVLLDPVMNATRKIGILRNTFNLPIGESVMEVLKDMGNFGTDVFRMGEKIGEKKGRKSGIETGIKTGIKTGARDANLSALASMTKEHDFSLQDAMVLMGLPLSDQSMYARLLAKEDGKKK